MKNIIRILTLAAFIIISVSTSFSEEISDINEKMNADEELTKEFEWVKAETAVTTEIATKTKMDAELTPGMVTILSGKDLKNRGIRTVYEAITLVPGINTSVNSLGDKLVSVRGIGGSFLSGNLKLMLNNLVLNDNLSATGYVLYGIPVEQIDRIEIIRGPGSVIYGEYAYAGVINVITRQKGNEVYGYYDGNDGRGGGGTFNYENPEKELSLNLNLSGWKSDGHDVEAGEDRLSDFYGMDLSEFSYSPGSTNEAQEDQLANISFNYKDFSLIWQYLSSGNGDIFGFLHVLPPDDDRIAVSHEHRALEARQRLNFSDKLDADFKAGWRRYIFHIDKMSALPPIPDITPPEGSIASPHYEERELFIGSEIIRKDNILKEILHNTLLAGIKYTDIANQNIWADANTGFESPGVMERIQGEYSWITEYRTRKIFSLYLQDIFSVTDHFSVTHGFRYDHYEDNDNSDDSLTPRISAVWQITDSHILKVQGSKAVRPPSFSELYSGGNSAVQGNKYLEPEQISSYEAGYIYRDQKTTGRITLFYSELKDNIAYPQYADSLGGGGIQYKNAADKLKTTGFEAELEKTLRPDLRFSANISFSDTEDEETGEPLENAVEWMGNAGITYEPLQDVMMFSMQYRYVGSPHRAADDDRQEPDAYHAFNLTANFFDILAKGVTFRWGIKNLFDDDIVYPAPVFKYKKEGEENEYIGYYYKDDFPRAGREWWAQISYEF